MKGEFRVDIIKGCLAWFLIFLGIITSVVLGFFDTGINMFYIIIGVIILFGGLILLDCTFSIAQNAYKKHCYNKRYKEVSREYESFDYNPDGRRIVSEIDKYDTISIVEFDYPNVTIIGTINNEKKYNTIKINSTGEAVPIWVRDHIKDPYRYKVQSKRVSTGGAAYTGSFNLTPNGYGSNGYTMTPKYAIDDSYKIVYSIVPI